MIRSVRHKGLRRLYEDDDRRGGRPDLVARIRDVLLRLDTARHPRDLDLPGYRLHRLSGELAGFWSVTISANWRLTFRFEDGDSFDLELIDYH